MKQFSELIKNLDQSKDEEYQRKILRNYFVQSPESDKVWSIYFLLGKRIKRSVTSEMLKQFALEKTKISEWLLGESDKLTGDFAETISLIISSGNSSNQDLLAEFINKILKLANYKPAERKNKIIALWNELDFHECFVFNKIILGGYFSVVQDDVLFSVLSEFTQVDSIDLKQRLNKNWNPEDYSFEELLQISQKKEKKEFDLRFFQPENFSGDLEKLENPKEWFAEIVFDEVRVKIVRQSNSMDIWLFDGNLITDQFPEFQLLSDLIPNDSIIDGVIVAIKPELKSSEIRLSRKKITKEFLQKYPVRFIASDLKYIDDENFNGQNFIVRRKTLQKLVAKINRLSLMNISESITFSSWTELDQKKNALKNSNSKILLHNLKSDSHLILKNKMNSIKSVLLYAQKGGELYPDYFSILTLGIQQNENQFISIAKTDCKLSEAEMLQIDEFVRKNTIEKLGPVRTVKPELVFEIEFERIENSPRRKSGFVLKSPVIISWNKNEIAENCIKLSELIRMNTF